MHVSGSVNQENYRLLNKCGFDVVNSGISVIQTFAYPDPLDFWQRGSDNRGWTVISWRQRQAEFSVGSVTCDTCSLPCFSIHFTIRKMNGDYLPKLKTGTE